MSLFEGLTGLAVIYRNRRVGMVYGISRIDNTVTVQYGADGPFSSHTQKMPRPATRAEVERAGLIGVGGLKILEEI